MPEARWRWALSNKTWDAVSDYVKGMTDLATDAATEHVDRLAKIWNSVGDEDFGADDVFSVMQDVAGAALHYTAKAYVQTRDLMLELAK